MNIEELREYCLSKASTTEEFPFDETTLVFKVAGKIFVITSIDEFDGVNLKCDPEKAIELREEYSGIEPGYHMNKKHWNTVRPNTDVSDNKIKELIDHSYEMVIKGLPKKVRMELK